jgi:hypothetical protein
MRMTTGNESALKYLPCFFQGQVHAIERVVTRIREHFAALRELICWRLPNFRHSGRQLLAGHKDLYLSSSRVQPDRRRLKSLADFGLRLIPPVASKYRRDEPLCYEGNHRLRNFLSFSRSLVGQPVSFSPAHSGNNHMTIVGKLRDDTVNSISGLPGYFKTIDNLAPGHAINTAERLLPKNYQQYGILKQISSRSQRDHATFSFHNGIQPELAVVFRHWRCLLFNRFQTVELRYQFLEDAELSLNCLCRPFGFKFVIPNFDLESTASFHTYPIQRLVQPSMPQNLRNRKAKTQSKGKNTEYVIPSSSKIGMCINCGKRVSYCGKPFSAEIACPHCGAVNVYEDSQQPIRLAAGARPHVNQCG